MINFNTLLSSFDEKGTLLKWLKNVEKSLNNASLQSVEVITVSDTQIKIKFVFADGTSVLSPVLDLPKGAKGDKGETGAVGATGNGIARIALTSTHDNVDTYTIYYTNGGTFNFNVTNGTGGGGTIDVQHLLALLEGSETVVVDLNEDGTKVLIKLDEDFKEDLATQTDIEGLQEDKQDKLVNSDEITVDDETSQLFLNNAITSKLARTLVTPMATPSEKIIVGVDETNAQVQYKLGEGLTIEGTTSPFTIKASGGGSSEAKYNISTINLHTRIFGFSNIGAIDVKVGSHAYTMGSANVFYFIGTESDGAYGIEIKSGSGLLVGFTSNGDRRQSNTIMRASTIIFYPTTDCNIEIIGSDF